MRVPFAVLADTYTACAAAIAGPEAKHRSLYNLTFRRSPRVAWPDLATDDRLVLWGLGDYLDEVLAGPLDFAAERAKAYFETSSLRFDAGPWRAAERLGYLPIRIAGLPDGASFYPGEPVIRVENTADGFGEMAAHVEATLLGMVACATARATATRHLRESMVDHVRADNPAWDDARCAATAEGLVHDFGMRASSTPLESFVYGRAHLLSFTGTDTAHAGYAAWEQGGVAASIMAHAHRIILGHATEDEAVQALADVAKSFPAPIASYLADTFGTRAFVERLAIPLALRYKERGLGRCVVRPDSGDPLAMTRMILDLAQANGLYEGDERGKLRSTHLSILLGDSVTPDLIDRVYAEIRPTHNATSWVAFGIGGWLRRQGDRDVLSAAYKLAAVGPDDRPVVKYSETPAKNSVPGRTRIFRGVPAGQPTTFILAEKGPRPPAHAADRVVSWEDGRRRAPVPFAETREASLISWAKLPPLAPDPIYSPTLMELRTRAL